MIRIFILIESYGILIFWSESHQVNEKKIIPGEYFNETVDTNFYSTVKTHTPLIDLDQCLEYSDVPRYKDINIKDEYANNQKFINVNAKVRIYQNAQLPSYIKPNDSLIMTYLGYRTLYLYEIVTILGRGG